MTQTSTNSKLHDLLEILSEKPRNLRKLKEFGRVHGFVNTYGRNLAMTCLADTMKSNRNIQTGYEQLKKEGADAALEHKSKHQIHVDVERAMNCIDFFIGLQEDQLQYHRGNLEEILQIFIFTNSPQYSYYQGFHDVTTVLLYTFGINEAFNVLDKLSENYFKDALTYPFEKSVNIQLELVLKILEHFDQPYAEAISTAYGGIPVFAVSWILTWFSHSFKKMATIQRIFDFLISSPPSSILYMCAATILISKEKLYETVDDDLDIAVIHTYFQKLDIEDPEFLISTTMEMEKQLDFQKVVETHTSQLPEDSVFLRFNKKHKRVLKNKYYQHELQRKSQNLLSQGEPNQTLQEKLIRNVGTAGLLVLLGVVSYKTLSRKKL